MSLITANHLGLHFLEKEVFSDVSFLIEEKAKIGLVGVNGAGKTSLFKLITGELEPTAGTLTIGKNCRVGIMEQHLRATAATLYEELLTVFQPLIEIEQELEQIHAAIDQNPAELEQLVERQQQLQDTFLAEGGLVYRSQVKATLLGLGFAEKEFDTPVEQLSGGQRSKLSLAKLLLAKADVLLLDEPTNHLDIAAVEWLEEFLKNYPETYLVISHDRYFLDQVTNQTYDLENHRLTCYKGNYSSFLEKKAKQREITLRHNENIQREIHRIEGIIEQQKRWNREKNLVTARSKQKSIDRLSQELVQVDALPKQLKLKLHTQSSSGNDVLQCQDLSKAFGEKRLFQHIDIDLKKGEKVFLLGENGCGKSTLFKIVLGELPADSGTVKLGANIKIGYFDQIQKLFHTERTVLAEIWDSFPKLGETEIRKALAAFLFTGKDLEKPCTVLSGGERARLGLLKIMLSGANFLLLDEPTNHLDIASREALETALADYEGTILAISHDRYFINRLASRILQMHDHQITNYLGDYDYYLEKKAALLQNRQIENNNKPAAASANKLDYQARKELASQRRKLTTQLTKTENKISQLEETIQILEETLGQPEVATDFTKSMDYSNQLEAAKEELDTAMLQWEEISLALEALPSEKV